MAGQLRQLAFDYPALKNGGRAFGVPQNDNGRTCARQSHSQSATPRREPRPEAIQTLASALEDVWRTVETSGSRFARPAYARAIREVLAKRIIEVAQRGE